MISECTFAAYCVTDHENNVDDEEDNEFCLSIRNIIKKPQYLQIVNDKLFFYYYYLIRLI